MAEKYFLSEPTAKKLQTLLNSGGEYFSGEGEYGGAARELDVPVYFRLTEPLDPCQSARAVEARLLHPECAEFEDVPGGLGTASSSPLKVYDIDQAIRRYNVGLLYSPDTPLPVGTIVQALQENTKEEINPGQNDHGFWRVVGVMGCDCGSTSPTSSQSSDPSEQSSGPSEPSSGPSGPSSQPPSHGSDSSKSTAIVPASWTPTGYAALFIAEMPDVRFDEVMTVRVRQEYDCIPVDPRFLEVCEVETMAVVSACPSEPVVLGAEFVNDHVELKFADPDPSVELTVTIRLSAIRRGFLGDRFTPRTERQFTQNERFINSAYEA